MTDGTGTTTYTYNNRNKLTKKTHGSSSFTYTYTADGLVSTRTYPDGHAVSNTYDADDRLAKVASGGETTTYAYDPDGDLTSTTLPSGTGVVESRTYDDADRLASVATTHGATTLDSYTITRDAAGNPTALSTPGGPVTYAYDSRERLTEACYGASCATNKETFTYDGVGNRLTSTTGGVTTTNTYNADDEVTKSVTGATTVTPTYDADGRMTAFGSVTYSWNAANQITAVGGPHAATYNYDGDGDRVTVKIGSATTTQTWDTNGPLPQLATTQGAAGTQNHLWGEGSLGFTTSAGSFYELHDDQGSTVGVISANGTLQSTAGYDPFGSTIAATKLVSSAPSTQIAWQGQVLYATGQYDLRAREYEPSTGQFLSRDPLEPPRSAAVPSPYAYAADMPTVLSDPTGECPEGNPYAAGEAEIDALVAEGYSQVQFYDNLSQAFNPSISFDEPLGQLVGGGIGLYNSYQALNEYTGSQYSSGISDVPEQAANDGQQAYNTYQAYSDANYALNF
jgi:RHS repeat-associated protein